MNNKQKILEIINNYYGIIEKDYPFVYGPMIDEIDALYNRNCEKCNNYIKTGNMHKKEYKKLLKIMNMNKKYGLRSTCVKRVYPIY